MMMKLFSTANAGKTVKTRWGGVAFNTSGVAKHDIPDEDMPLVQQLGWHVDVAAERERAVKAITAAPAAVSSTTIEVQVSCHEARNRTVKTRWGAISFDAAGLASVKLPEGDVALLGQLGWAVVPVAAPPAVDDQTTKKSKKAVKDGE